MQARTTQPPDPSIISSLTTLETHRYRDALFYVLAQSRLLGESCKETKLAAPSTSPDHETLQPPTATNEGSVVPNMHFFALRALPCPRSFALSVVQTAAHGSPRRCSILLRSQRTQPRTKPQSESQGGETVGGDGRRRATAMVWRCGSSRGAGGGRRWGGSGGRCQGLRAFGGERAVGAAPGRSNKGRVRENNVSQQHRRAQYDVHVKLLAVVVLKDDPLDVASVANDPPA